MKNKAILVVSFGTSYEETMQKNIKVVETKIAETFKDYEVFSAYTSTIVRKILLKRGIEVDDVASAMKRMSDMGISEVVLQPTHLLYGIEYEKMKSQAEMQASNFAKVTYGKPLLSCTEDLETLLDILPREIEVKQDQALVLMGHGTHHFSNVVYPALNYMASTKGLPHIFIGTVEGYPELDQIIEALKRTSYKKVLLTPLMLVAGDHATNDMASDEPESWKTVLSEHGYEVECLIKGLGEYPSIVNMYLEHLKSVIH